MSKRPARLAAQAASSRLSELAHEQVVIGSSESELSDDAAEDEDEESSSNEAEPPQLSAYELQRLDNIRKNNAVLADLDRLHLKPRAGRRQDRIDLRHLHFGPGRIERNQGLVLGLVDCGIGQGIFSNS
jgi:hypothetical protein